MISASQVRKYQASTISNSELGDFEISWAGEGPGNRGYCLGSEDGRVWFFDDELHRGPGPYQVAESGEAVNCVAFWGDIMAVSTRSEVVLRKLSEAGEIKDRPSLTFRGGAHDVHFNASGRLIASLGQKGLLEFGSLEANPVTTQIVSVPDKPLYFYKAVSLGRSPTGSVSAYAVRRDGLVAVVGDRPATYMALRAIPNIDIIDVCSLSTPTFPLATAAIGIDCTLLLMRDVSPEHQAKILNIQGLQGTAYRVLASQGHAIILTSQFIYRFDNLFARFLNGDRMDEPMQGIGMEIEAVDASIVHGGRILFVTPDGLSSFDVEAWGSEVEASNGSGDPRVSNDEVESSIVETDVSIRADKFHRITAFRPHFYTSPTGTTMLDMSNDPVQLQDGQSNMSWAPMVTDGATDSVE